MPDPQPFTDEDRARLCRWSHSENPHPPRITPGEVFRALAYIEELEARLPPNETASFTDEDRAQFQDARANPPLHPVVVRSELLTRALAHIDRLEGAVQESGQDGYEVGYIDGMRRAGERLQARIDRLEGQSPARTPGDTDMAATDDEVIEVLEFRLTRAAARIDHLEGALREAADDLGKAANQFEGLKLAGKPPENNGAIFAVKEARARAALKGENDGT